MTLDQKHIVILGGGFAGLNAAKDLGGAPARVTVVDSHNHHVFQPMLYQVATAALSPGDIASPIRSILRAHRNIDVLLDEATDIDPQARRVHLRSGKGLSYDYLIVATGARHSYFGHEEWAPFAPGLKSLEDAFEIRRRILMAFELAEQEPDPARQAELLNFVIVGGGPTGVEMAGAIAEIKEFTLRRDFRNIDPRTAKVQLIEAGTRLLPSYPAILSAKAQRTLERLGVQVSTDTSVTDIRVDTVVAGPDILRTRTVIWAAGNIASPLLRTLDAPLDRQGRALVAADCTVPGHRDIFILGDAASYTHQGTSPLPGICPVAVQMGEYAAKVIRKELVDPGTGPRRPFHYLDKGQLAVIGRGRAVADIRKAHFDGFPAWLIWIFVHIFFLIGFRNRLIVMTEWAISFFTYSRGARLITHGGAPDAPGP